MKKSLVILTIMAMVLGLMVLACGSDDEDGAGTEGGPCRAADDEAGECDEGLFCDADKVCQPVEEEDGDADEAGTEGNPCREEGEACDEGLVCNDDKVCEVVEEEVCVDDDCPGAATCNDAGECEVFCVGTKFNEDCPSATGFATELYGECADVPCSDDADCAGLGACDDPGKSSTKNFVCNASNLCVRQR